MRRWRQFAGLADELKNAPFEIILANPFVFTESVYPKVLPAAKKVGLESGRPNLRFLHHAKHPRVGRHRPEIAPGWNSSNGETRAREREANYALFDRDGQLVFSGRASFEEIRKRVLGLLRKR